MREAYRKGWLRALEHPSLPLGPEGTAAKAAGKKKGLSKARRRSYRLSYAQGIRASWKSQLLKQNKKRDLSIIIPAMNEQSTIGKVLRQAKRLKPREIIVVCNGSTDKTTLIAQAYGCVVLNYDRPLGHDIGRALGAEHAKGEILLFLDADFAVKAEELLPFVRSIDSGADLALNHLEPLLPRPSARDTISNVKQWLNVSLQRPDLGSASLTAVPHAVRRSFIQPFGMSCLSVPPKAQLQFLQAGAKAVLANCVDVIKPNRLRRHNGALGKRNKVEEMIVGDHIEAVAWLQEQEVGVRGITEAADTQWSALSPDELNVDKVDTTTLSTEETTGLRSPSEE